MIFAAEADTLAPSRPKSHISSIAASVASMTATERRVALPPQLGELPMAVEFIITPAAPRSPEELRRLALRAREAMKRRFFRDPVDREQIRYFAEWFEHTAASRQDAEEVVS